MSTPKSMNDKFTRGPRGYRPETTSQRIVRFAVWGGVALVAWLVLWHGAAYFATRYYVPYTEMLNEERDFVQQAHIKLTHQNSPCKRTAANDDLRVQTPLFDECARAEVKRNSWPPSTAFYRLLESHSVCTRESCFNITVGVFSYMGLIFYGSLLGMALVVLTILACMCSLYYKHFVKTKHDLPWGMGQIQWAANQQPCTAEHHDD